MGSEEDINRLERYFDELANQTNERLEKLEKAIFNKEHDNDINLVLNAQQWAECNTERIEKLEEVINRNEDFLRDLVYKYLNKGKDEYGEDINYLLQALDYTFELMKSGGTDIPNMTTEEYYGLEEGTEEPPHDDMRKRIANGVHEIIKNELSSHDFANSINRILVHCKKCNNKWLVKPENWIPKFKLREQCREFIVFIRDYIVKNNFSDIDNMNCIYSEDLMESVKKEYSEAGEK